MKYNKAIHKIINLLFYSFLGSFLFACADEGPISILEEDIQDDISDIKYEIKEDSEDYYDYLSSSSMMQEKQACYYGTSYNSDSWCCSNFGYQCSYSSSSYTSYSSSSYVSESEKCRLGTSSYSDSYCCSYYGYQCGLDESKTMLFTLTYYEQKTSGWDGLQNAGDPEIYFNIYTYSEGISAQTLKTGVMLNRSDLTYWSGSISTKLTLIQGVDSIRVCPHITDEDVSAHDDYSSGYCYSINEIGTLEDYEVVEQSDYYNSDASVKWEWYLY